MRMVELPTSFDPPGYHDEDHLTISEAEGLVTVSWPTLGVDIVVTKRQYPPLDEAARHTPGLQFYGQSGFTIDTYHEFFIEFVPEFCSFRLGSAAVSIGEVTPLAVFLFDQFHDRHYHGDEWEAVSTVRIVGASSEHAEAYLLNALRLYSDRYGIEPSTMRIAPVEWWDDEKEREAPTGLASVPIDLEPLRFDYHARRESDDSAACVQFYRILEFYAFFDLESSVAKLRNDPKLSDREFLVRVAGVIARDERTPVIRLVAKLARTPLLRRAAKAGLIAQPQAELLGSAIYDLRNSVVHAKYDQRAAIVAQPVLEQPSPTREWRHILQELAASAIDRLAKKYA